MVAQQHDIQVGQPEHYDPTRAASYVRGTEIERIRNQARAELQDDRQAADAEKERRRLAAQMNMKVLAVEGAKAVARIRASSSGRAGAVGRAMTGGQAENMRFKIAEGLIGHAGGSYDEAVAFLNSKDGDDLRKQGVKPEHLMYAHSLFVKGGTAQAISLQRGMDGLPVPDAVKAVTDTRSQVAGTAPKDSVITLPKDSTKKGPSAITKPSVPKDDFTDDEIADAMKAGKTTPADVAAFIKEKRKGKKK
jgi:hypothetical protein